MTIDGLSRVLGAIHRRIRIGLQRSTKARPRSQPVWEGIFPHYRDVPKRGLAYQGEQLAQESVDAAKALLDALGSAAEVPQPLTADLGLFPLLACVIGVQKRAVRILDFGGGAGIHYLHLLTAACGSNWGVEYHIVETATLCGQAQQLFEEDPRVKFHATLPDQLGGIDVVHLSSSLQYIDDYAGLLRRLCAYQAPFLFLSKLSAGGVPTYASAQMNLGDASVPYWFLNANEVINLVCSSGYQLVFRCVLEREYDQSNFPSTHRLGKTCNLLFHCPSDHLQAASIV